MKAFAIDMDQFWVSLSCDMIENIKANGFDFLDINYNGSISRLKIRESRYYRHEFSGGYLLFDTWCRTVKVIQVHNTRNYFPLDEEIEFKNWIQRLAGTAQRRREIRKQRAFAQVGE